MNYPLGKIFEESALTKEWLDNIESTRAILVQGAVGSLLSKEGGKAFESLLERLKG
jgi:hypothetical protein